jgi:hypothetical protein
MKGFIEIVASKGATLVAVSKIACVEPLDKGCAVYVDACREDDKQLIINTRESYTSVIEQIRTALF